MTLYSAMLPWRVIASRVARLARPELPYQMALVILGLFLSVATGLTLTLGLVVIYRLLGVGSGFGNEGLAEDIIGQFQSQSLWTLAALTIGLALASSILSEVSRVVAEVIANRMTHRARASIYAAYLETTYQEASARGHGTILDILDYEAPFLTASVIHVTHIVTSAIMITVYAVYLVLLSPTMGLAIMVLALALGATLGLASRRLSQLGSFISNLNERLLAHTIATVEGMRTIRLHGVETSFIARYRGASSAVSEAHVKLARAHAMTAGLRQIWKLMTLATLVGAAVLLKVPTESAILVFAVLLRAIPLVTDVEERVLSLFNAQLPLSIVCDALDPALVRVPSTGERAFSGIRNTLSFQDIAFSHNPETSVLRGVTFTIPAGQLVTLVGPSGGGKTTLINLLARLYEPQGGEILVDGVPLFEIDRAAWLARLGFSGQDIDLQEGTVFENIAFYSAHITEADVWWALKIAHADDFIRAHPDGLQAMVGDRGLRLSGGQRQRIGLARAIARRPDLLILDEATNAIDIALEARIYHAIREALPKATILVITHRTAVDHAAAQFMLSDGQVRTVSLPRLVDEA